MTYRMTRHPLAALLASFTLIAAACGPAQPGQPTRPSGGNVVTGQASIERITLVMLESFPVQVRINVRGSLPDSCTSIGETRQSMEGNTIRFEILTTRPTDAQCTQALVPFEQTFPLDVVGLPAGTYTVDVNGVTGTFTLAVDNVPQRNPAQVCPGGTDEQIAFINEADGYCFLYPAGFELSQPGGGLVVISGPARGEGPQPARATLAIQNEGPAGGRTTDDVGDEKLREFRATGVEIIRGTINLGDEEAFVVDGVPGATLTRQAYIVHHNAVYVLTLSPADDASPEVGDDVEQLWETVVSSFTFTAAASAPVIPWSDAETLILSGEVQQVFQAHSLEVRLTLKDGRQVVSREPSIDEVFRVVDRCGEACAGIALATE